MRKLGHGHLVMFFAPLEVDLSIRAMASKKDPNTQVTTVDILCWARPGPIFSSGRPTRHEP